MRTEEKSDLFSMEKDRLVYMVSWRDRYIKSLEARLAGHEEESAILQTLLFYALVKAGRENEKGNTEIRIAKREIAELLGKWRCEAIREGEEYSVTFTPAVIAHAEAEIRDGEAQGE